MASLHIEGTHMNVKSPPVLNQEEEDCFDFKGATWIDPSRLKQALRKSWRETSVLIFLVRYFFSKKKRENPLYTLSRGTNREREKRKRKRIIKQMMLWVVLYVLNSCQKTPQRNYYSLMHITDKNRDCVMEPPDLERVIGVVDRCSVRSRRWPDRYPLPAITRDIRRSVAVMFDVPVLIADRNRAHWTDRDCFHHRRDHPKSFWSRRTRDSVSQREDQRSTNHAFDMWELRLGLVGSEQ